MGRFAKVLMIGLAALGVLGWMLLVMLGGMVMHSPVSAPGIQEDTPGLHADEAVQWSLAKDSSEGVPYSINQDKFHGPALAVAAQVVLAARSIKFDDASEADLRLVPFLFYLLICAAPFFLRDVAWPTRCLAAFLLLMGSAGCYFGHYFIQEPLLVAGFVWGVLLWLQSAGGERPAWWALFSGAAFGLSLACKVTALAYLGILLVALLVCARETLSWRRVGWATLGAVVVWVSLQTVLFTDWEGMIAWALQLWRSFAVASGNEDTLTLTNPGYWWTVGLWLAALVGIRLVRGGQRSAEDVPLALAVGCFLFHLALPYKTPWLLFLPVCLSLTMAWPLLAQRGAFLWLSSAVAATAFVIACTGTLERHTPTRARGDVLAATLGEFQQVWQKAHPGKPFYVAIDGGHYWPLPYYLRAFQVGYGEFDGAERAPVRILEAHDSSRPAVPGYQTHRLRLRRDEDYWVLLDATNMVDTPFYFGSW
jgi:hypothetical protein